MFLFPACAGVILSFTLSEPVNAAFPRVCGGDPYTEEEENKLITFSPRVRG